MMFNHKILTPDFINDNSGKKRNLMALSSIDVLSIFDLTFVLKSDVDPNEIIYSLEFLEWNQETV